MTRLLRYVGLAMLIATACTGASDEQTDERTGIEPRRGGTLRLAISSDVNQAWDPAEEYEAVAWEVFRCCLTRTLLSFEGTTADNGGNEPQPDVAAAMPEVSEDGLTYTFTLKEGITYAPPYEDTQVVAQDFVRAIERLACESCANEGYPFYYEVIEGFSDSDGGAGSVSGAEALDDSTLQITLTQPTGDFPFRMTMPATAPIPEGAAEGHDDDYGLFLVSSGPYMFEGSEKLDHSLAPKQQEPVEGYDPGRSWVLVRNPSWDQETDDLRSGWVDRIEVEVNATTKSNFEKLEAGEIDLVLEGTPPPEVLTRYSSDPELSDVLEVHQADGLFYASMNLAQPPFDDVHVRKAMNLVIDKDAFRRVSGGELFGDIATHIVPDGMLDFRLDGYDPYPSPDGHGDVEAAKAEMAQSRYDENGDGLCDHPSCEDTLLVGAQDTPYIDQATVVADSAEQIGIEFDVRSGDLYTFMFPTCFDPEAAVAFCPHLGWFKDYSDPETFLFPLLHSSGIVSANASLVGAPSSDLRKWGYQTAEVPSLDEQIEACTLEAVGEARQACWEAVDRAAMEEVVPIVPFVFSNQIFIKGPRIRNFVFDSAAGFPSLEDIALAGT
jgi:peptide/nickel transport system substrate-binding protein